MSDMASYILLLLERRDLQALPQDNSIAFQIELCDSAIERLEKKLGIKS